MRFGEADACLCFYILYIRYVFNCHIFNKNNDFQWNSAVCNLLEKHVMGRYGVVALSNRLPRRAYPDRASAVPGSGSICAVLF